MVQLKFQPPIIWIDLGVVVLGLTPNLSSLKKEVAQFRVKVPQRYMQLPEACATLWCDSIEKIYLIGSTVDQKLQRAFTHLDLSERLNNNNKNGCDSCPSESQLSTRIVNAIEQCYSPWSSFKKCSQYFSEAVDSPLQLGNILFIPFLRNMRKMCRGGAVQLHKNLNIMQGIQRLFPQNMKVVL